MEMRTYLQYTWQDMKVSCCDKLQCFQNWGFIAFLYVQDVFFYTTQKSRPIQQHFFLEDG